jgi:hypothetical protein
MFMLAKALWVLLLIPFRQAVLLQYRLDKMQTCWLVSSSSSCRYTRGLIDFSFVKHPLVEHQKEVLTPHCS